MLILVCNSMPSQGNETNSDARMTRGLAIFETKGHKIKENEDGSFSVPSQTSIGSFYEVRLIETKYVCTCPDFENREIEFCKHVHAVKFWIASNTYLKEQAKPKIFAEDSIQCDKCGSIRVIRYGISAQKQVFKCKDCKHKFTPSLIGKSKFTPELISLTLDLYFSGLSLRKIARTISDHTNQSLGATTIYEWIQKFVPKISEYANSLSPQLSDTWHADELFVKMKDGIKFKVGKREYDKTAFLWNVMDRKTRFLLASKLSPLRDHIGANRAFDEARKNAHGNYPETVFTDSAGAYAHIKYSTAKDWEINHIKNVGIRKPHATNNRIERMNGTLRERVKVQRGWKSFESQIAEGMRIHYNFVKPHQALEGMTPAQRAGIPIENKWLTLFKESLKRS